MELFPIIEEAVGGSNEGETLRSLLNQSGANPENDLNILPAIQIHEWPIEGKTPFHRRRENGSSGGKKQRSNLKGWNCKSGEV